MILFCQSERKVFFNPVVKVHIVKRKYDRSYWWTNEDYYNFKQHAIINKIYSLIKKEIKQRPPPPSPIINQHNTIKNSRRLPLIRGIF